MKIQTTGTVKRGYEANARIDRGVDLTTLGGFLGNKTFPHNTATPANVVTLEAGSCLALRIDVPNGYIEPEKFFAKLDHGSASNIPTFPLDCVVSATAGDFSAIDSAQRNDKGKPQGLDPLTARWRVGPEFQLAKFTVEGGVAIGAIVKKGEPVYLNIRPSDPIDEAKPVAIEYHHN